MQRTLLKIGVSLILIFGIGVTALVLFLQNTLPDNYYVVTGEKFSLDSSLITVKEGSSAQVIPAQSVSSAGSNYSAQLSLGGVLDIKTVNVQVIERNMVIPAGIPFGIKMFTQGVMVVGLSDIDISGKGINPAKNAGIKTGDVVLSIGGEKVQYNEDVGKIVNASNGVELEVVIKRDNNLKTLKLTPIKSPIDDSYKVGMWVRDSSAGIGTMTYYDPETKVFAGLGHAICDVDTGALMPLYSGEAVEANITGVNKGVGGSPGELKGVFNSAKIIGDLFKNDVTGIYGTAKYAPLNMQPVPMATKHEVVAGAATIYTTINGKQPQAYDIMIEKISANDSNPTKNMIIRITDSRLIEATGGIVQGMSGSPIIQNGKLIGAVTHVFVNDPTKGYGIFAENMAISANSTANQLENAS